MPTTKNTTQTNAPEKSKTKRCVQPDEVATVVHDICDYDDQTASNLLRLMAEVERLAFEPVMVCTFASMVSHAAFMHTIAAGEARRTYVDGLCATGGRASA